MINRLAMLGIVVVLGCSKTQPPKPATIKVDAADPALTAADAEGADWTLAEVAWITQANDEAERFQREQAAIDAAGVRSIYQAAEKAYAAIFREYAGGRSADWPVAARQFVEKVRDKRLRDFDPDPEKTAARLLDQAKTLAADGKPDDARKCYQLAAADFPATKAGQEARRLLE